jgi:alkylation response protein AidB-like acyl-CoA dehydrogenase
MRRRADAAGWLRYGLPEEFGGRGGTNLDMAVIREHLAHKGLGLHNDLQDESSIVGNFPQVIMMSRFGTDAQKAEWIEAMLTGTRSMAFGLTEPDHGSDATWMETTAVRERRVTGSSMAPNAGTPAFTGPPTTWSSPEQTVRRICHRDHGLPGAHGRPGFEVPYWWTFNMPSDHGEVTLTDVRVPADAVLGEVDHGLEVGQTFLHENRIRQAASSLGAAQYCIDRAAEYAGERVVRQTAVGQPGGAVAAGGTADRGADGPPAGVLRGLAPGPRSPHGGVDKVSMANYRANRLVCEAADRAMQIHGGIGYSRHEPFEHIYRHHRRYRITEGAEEIQMRRVAQRMLKFRPEMTSAEPPG